MNFQLNSELNLFIHSSDIFIVQVSSVFLQTNYKHQRPIWALTDDYLIFDREIHLKYVIVFLEQDILYLVNSIFSYPIRVMDSDQQTVITEKNG